MGECYKYCTIVTVTVIDAHIQQFWSAKNSKTLDTRIIEVCVFNVHLSVPIIRFRGYQYQNLQFVFILLVLGVYIQVSIVG